MFSLYVGYGCGVVYGMMVVILFEVIGVMVDCEYYVNDVGC